MSYRNEKPKVLVDMDGVISNFDAAIAVQLDRLNIEVDHPLDRQQHNILHSYPQEYHDTIREIIYSHDFFNEVPIYDDALDGWSRLLTLGYEPVVCTSPLPNNQRSIEAKKEWIKDNLVPYFGEKALTMAQITLDKHNVPGYALIDDRPIIQRATEASWRHVLFSRSYNLNINSSLRIDSWGDPKMKTILGSISINNL